MENSKRMLSFLIIGKEEVFPGASNLVNGFGGKLEILVEIDCATTNDAGGMMIKKKYDKIVWVCFDQNSLAEKIFKIFEKKLTRLVV